MADIISRLKLESGEFDSKIKRAGQELLAYSEHCRKTGLQMGFANQDAKDFAKALGNMETTSRTARGQVNELSEAFVNLRVMYKQMTDEEKKGDFGRGLSASLDRLKQRINATKADLADATRELSGSSFGGGGNLFGGKLDGMLSVFGGNLMTKAAGAVASLGSEMADMVKQGVELARQGEGIRIAFERLGRGDLLDGLREATHGTVTDLELMKAAVKFNDFKLPLEELGVLLQFAQQKAKDTGQSVDYMVESITNGLGRQSKPILDNLGISAKEIEERMKSTGDFTKAVGEIIREQMIKAGDYIETAADRATKANVSMQNKMEELGRKFAPIEEASNQLWTSMKIGILDIIGGPLATLLSQLTEAGRMANQYREIGGDTKVGSMVQAYNNSSDKDAYAKAVNASYTAQINQRQDIYNRLMAWRSGNRSAANGRAFDDMERLGFGRGNDQTLRSNIAALRAQQAAFNRAIKTHAAPQLPTTVTTPTTTTTAPRPKVETKEKELTIQQQIAKLEEEAYTATDERRDAIAKQVQELDKQLERQKAIRDEVHGIVKETKEIKAVQDKLADAQYATAVAIGNNDLKSYYAAQKKVAAEGGPVDNTTAFSYTQNNLDAFIGNLKERISQSEVGSDLFNALTSQLADAQLLGSFIETAVQNGIDVSNINPQAIFTKIFGDGKTAGDYIEDSFWKDLGEAMSKGIGENLSINTTEGKIGKDSKGKRDVSQDMSKALSGVTSVVSGLEAMGINMGDDVKNVINVVQGVMSVIQGVQTVISIFQATSMSANTAAMVALTSALWANTATSWFPFANGGIVPTFAQGGVIPKFADGGLIGRAALGITIPGNSMSGDNLRLPVDGGRGLIGVNSGEVILNRSQQGVLASELQGNPMRNMTLSTVVRGEEIRFVLNTNGRRTGRGEYVQSKSKSH